MIRVFDDLLGLPFADGGRGPDTFDCWGLVVEVYKRYGVQLPNYPIENYKASYVGDMIKKEFPKWKEVEQTYPIPSVVLIQMSYESWANHVGVYIGNGLFIHAYKASGVTIARVKKWRASILGFYVPIVGDET